MPIFAIIVSAVGSVLLSLFVALGVGLVTYNFVLPSFFSLIQGYFSSLPGLILQTVGYFKLDIFITLVLSGASAGLTSKVSFKKV